MFATESLQAQSSLSNGLAAYYPFNGNAIDASGNGMDATVVGAGLTLDRFGAPASAYHFDGTNWIQLPDEILPVSPSELTLSIWVMAGNGASGIQQEILDLTTRRGECGLSISYNTADSWAFGVHLQSSGWPTIYSPLTRNTWTHLVGTFKQGESMQLWVNGRLIQSNAVPNEPLFLLPTYQLNSAIGIYDWAPGPYLGFDGALDELRIYNRALSPDEVVQLYQLEAGVNPAVALVKAVKPVFNLLSPGTGYQLQVSGDLVNWTNHGSSFTATNASMIFPEYWDVDNWDQLYFRLQVSP